MKKKATAATDIPRYAWVMGVLVIAILGAIFYAIAAGRQQTQGDSPLVEEQAIPSVSATSTPSSTQVIAADVPKSSGVTPAPVPSSTPIALPATAQTALANFYSAYESGDKARLLSLFTSDTTADQEADRGSIAAIPVVQGYTILGSAPQLPNWAVTIEEQRVQGTNTVVLTLVPAPAGTGTWLVDRYVETGSTGKYSGFFTE